MLRRIAHHIRHRHFALAYRDSGTYWEHRYKAGGTSGAGSYGPLAEYKSAFLNAFVSEHGLRTVIELGCGDGNQLSLAEYPRYLGLDIAKTAIDKCSRRFAADTTKSFLWYEPNRTVNLGSFVQADLTLSLDVIYHLVEDSAYDDYLRNLFSLSRRFVIVYSSDMEDRPPAPHVRHRKFTSDAAELFPQFRLIDTKRNKYPTQSHSRFFVFERE